MMGRRDAIALGTRFAALLALFPQTLFATSGAPFSPVCSAARTSDGRHRLGVWQDSAWRYAIDAPQRGHDACVNRQRGELIFIQRRPGRYFYVADLATGELRHSISARQGYHFYGHGVVGHDGRLLYTTENDTNDRGRGVIAVYDCHHDYQWLGHWDCGGIGPHQLALMPDERHLVIAIGGLKTLPATGRTTLNPDSLRPGLSYLDLATGHLTEFVAAPLGQLSLRHLDVSPFGEVIVGAQFQGAVPSGVPLIYRHRPGEMLRPLDTDSPLPLRRDYIASVACGDDHTVICTMPRDNLVTLWSTRREGLVQSWHLPDCAGAVYDSRFRQFIISNGSGQLMAAKRGQSALTPLAYAPGLNWDNHLTLLSTGTD